MARPRRIVPGSSYLITRRCVGRAFRLRPSNETTRIIKYCLALALAKTGVVLHAICVMSNHHHVVVTDPHGVLPLFLREFHRACAKALNRAQGQVESLWAAEPCNVVQLAADVDVIDKVAYLVANPVAAGLVAAPEEWPGVLMWQPREETVERPNVYFSEGSESPARLTLRVHEFGLRDPGAGRDGWCRRVGDAIAARVASARRAMVDSGRAFLGRAAVLAQRLTDRASSPEPRDRNVPTFAARQRDMHVALREALHAFQVAYRDALDKWCDGVRDVVFPFGTWWMRVHHGARIAAASTDAAA